MRGLLRSLRARMSGQSLHTQDLRAQAPAPKPDRDVDFDRAAADVRLAVRTQHSARSATKGRVRRAVNAATKAEERHIRTAQFVASARSVLSEPRTRARMAKAVDYDKRHTLLGFLGAWVPAVLMVVVIVAMLLNDPGMVYTAVRTALEVRESTFMFDISDIRILTALGAALGVSAALILAATAGGHAFATLLFHGGILTDEVEPHDEVHRSHRLMGVRSAAIIAAFAVAVIAGGTFLIHGFAEARMQSAVIIGEESPIAASVVRLITGLPLLLLVLETIMCHPALKADRDASRWAAGFRRKSRKQIRREQRLVRSETSAVDDARKAITALMRTIEDVALRSLYETATSALTTGIIDMRDIAKGYREVPTDVSQPADPVLPVALTGSAANAYLRGLGTLGAEVADAINRWHELQAKASAPVLDQVWHNVRQDPDGYCAIEDGLKDGTTSLTCASAPVSDEVTPSSSTTSQSNGHGRFPVAPPAFQPEMQPAGHEN